MACFLHLKLIWFLVGGQKVVAEQKDLKKLRNMTNPLRLTRVLPFISTYFLFQVPLSAALIAVRRTPAEKRRAAC